MFVVSNLVGSTIQITTLPLPVLSTLQASGLVFNTAFATLLLKEPFTRFSFIGTLLTCVGAALIATFGAIGEPAHNLAQLLYLLHQKDFIIWMVATLVVAAGTVLLAYLLNIWASHKHIEKHHILKHERSRSPSSPKMGANKRSFTAQLPQPLQVRISRLRLARGLAYALISGILSAHSLLVAKSAVELLVRTIVDHNNQFNRFQSWLILLALLFFALTQLYYLHLGLRLCSTSVLYPFVFCIYNIVAILDGLIYFQQGSRLTTLHACLVAVGTVVLLLGVLALSWRLEDTPQPDPDPAGPQLSNPLTPGMGLIHTGDASETSPLLPTSLPRDSIDEEAPLRSHHSSTANYATIYPAAEVVKDIWAELDDDRVSPPLLAQDDLRVKRRARSGSARMQSTPSNGQASAKGESPGHTQTGRASQPSTRRHGILRHNTAPSVPVLQGQDTTQQASQVVGTTQGEDESGNAHHERPPHAHVTFAEQDELKQSWWFLNIPKWFDHAKRKSGNGKHDPDG